MVCGIVHVRSDHRSGFFAHKAYIAAMERRPGHLPADSANCLILFDHAPFAPWGNPESGKLLDGMEVTGITAIKYQCTARWKISDRRIADDMFFYVLDGCADSVIDGRPASVGPGDAIHVRRGALHDMRTDPRNPIRVICLHYTATIAGTISVPELFGFPDAFRFGKHHDYRAMFEEACREYGHQPPGWRRSLPALVVRFLSALIRDNRDVLSPARSKSALPDLRRLQPAVDAMSRNLDHPISMIALAKLCRLSPAQFRRVFARACGRSPIAYQRRLRLQEACRLLRQTDETVERVAGLVGYAEPSFFARTFRTHIGMSPGRYRASEQI
jgi:AraC-like DNA-binding protein/mannose-6-phosphate isomerase-like protein (cupin superfamily)